MKNNTTIHTTLNIRYMGKNWQLSSNKIRCQGTLNPDFHHNPATSEPKKQDGWMVYEEFTKMLDYEEFWAGF